MDDKNPLYRNDADSNCKYPICVPEKGLCLSLKEADFVYTCIERDNIVTPFEIHNAELPSVALHSFDFDFDDHFEVDKCEAPTSDMLSNAFSMHSHLALVRMRKWTVSSMSLTRTIRLLTS